MRAIVLASSFAMLAFVLPGTPAFATTLVVHSGVGRDCYLETLRDSATAEQNQQSLKICDQAVDDARVDPGGAYDYAAALANRADVKLRMQDFQGVIADAEKALSLDATLGPAHLNRAAGLIGLMRFREALPSLDQAIALKAHNLESAYFDRGLAKESLGDIGGAYRDYLMAVQINPRFDRAAQELTRFKVTKPAT